MDREAMRCEKYAAPFVQMVLEKISKKRCI